MGVVACILPLLGPALGVKRMADRSPDPPGREVVGSGAEHQDARLVQRQHSVETNLEQLLDVPQVADDLLRRPVARAGTAAQLAVRLPGNRPLEVARRLLQTVETR